MLQLRNTHGQGGLVSVVCYHGVARVACFTLLFRFVFSSAKRQENVVSRVLANEWHLATARDDTEILVSMA